MIMIAINVYSPKGGVGTTTIASMLALEVSRQLHVGLISRDPDASCAALGFPGAAVPIKLNHGLTVSDNVLQDVDVTIMDSRAHVAAADLNILVVQNTYMCLRKALSCKFDILVAQIIPGSALDISDIRSITGCDENVAIMNWDVPAARTLDAGLASKFIEREDFKAVAQLVHVTLKQTAPF